MVNTVKSWKADWHWFALLAITILINVPMLSPKLLFTIDTLHAFTFFHFAYSELLLHDEVPRWIPYLGFGTTFDFNLWNTIQPADYVTMAVGWLFGVRDTLLLYKVSLILCQCFLMLGLYLLSRKCFTSMLTVWLVCLGGLLTTNSIFSSPWSLTAYYLVPLVLWFVLRFMESKNPAHLWLAGLTEGLALLGTVPYIAPLHLFIVAAFLVPWLCREPGLVRDFVNWRNFVHPLFFAFVAFYLLIGTWIMGIDVFWMVSGRDSATGNVPLETFLGRDLHAGQSPAARRHAAHAGQRRSLLWRLDQLHRHLAVGRPGLCRAPPAGHSFPERGRRRVGPALVGARRLVQHACLLLFSLDEEVSLHQRGLEFSAYLLAAGGGIRLRSAAARFARPAGAGTGGLLQQSPLGHFHRAGLFRAGSPLQRQPGFLYVHRFCVPGKSDARPVRPSGCQPQLRQRDGRAG